ncbi:MAG: DNA polymerase IV, partial [Candidatus Gottesmanbacteria bacterium]|nr:DNA polymerase IV [Candidatus Gottesmanbacteria bacterium]
MFNPAPATVMHIDLNSCFATIEQQANPLYRGLPLVVAAYTTDRGCILAASVEAKRLGIKTGMYVGDGKRLSPKLIVLPSDPPKYRFVNRKLLALLSEYSALVEVKSIDEMVMKMNTELGILNTAKEIKKRIKNEIGDWLTVSIGIAPNRYLAKIASNLHKPDGLDVIDSNNIERTLGSLQL